MIMRQLSPPQRVASQFTGLQGVGGCLRSARISARHWGPTRLLRDVENGARVAWCRRDDGLMADLQDVSYPRATVEGFTMGMFVSYDDCGDAWVEAPDGAVATLIWETGPALLRRADPAGSSRAMGHVRRSARSASDN